MSTPGKGITSPEPEDEVALKSLEQKFSRKITKKNLAKFQTEILLEQIEPLLTEAFAAIRRGIKDGSAKHIQMALEVTGLMNSAKSPSVITNVYAKSESRSEVNNTTNEVTVVNSFESLARKLDARDTAAKAGQIIDISIDDYAS